MTWNEQEFSRLFEELYAPLLRFLTGFSGDAGLGEDLTQETLLRLYRRAGMDDDAARFWVFRTGRNLALNALRQRRIRGRLRRMFGRELYTEPDRADGETLRAETVSRQLELLSSLSDPQRAALLLREQEGLTYRRIASVLDISESKVKVDIHRARVGLRRRWESGAGASRRRERSS